MSRGYRVEFQMNDESGRFIGFELLGDGAIVALEEDYEPSYLAEMADGRVFAPWDLYPDAYNGVNYG